MYGGADSTDSSSAPQRGQWKEAATALGIPIGTVSSRITRARRHLAGAIAHDHPSEPTELRTEPNNA